MLSITQKKASTGDENCKVLQFPGMGAKPKKQHLSDEDINSLFMGLVKIVKENAVQDSGKKVQSFLEQAEMQKRKELSSQKQKKGGICNEQEKAVLRAAGRIHGRLPDGSRHGC